MAIISNYQLESSETINLCKMSYTKSVLQLFISALFVGMLFANTQAQNWQLVWSDEFNGDERSRSSSKLICVAVLNGLG